MFGIFTNRGDGCTYGYNQFEFITDNIHKQAVQDKLKSNFNLTELEVLELTTSYNMSIYFDSIHYDNNGDVVESIYIEKLEII